ncbi:hypothetical protein [Chiayiivirga flava]|uniref:Uncharacterized protein n=1 Tax=Chiayiivirga flava TaxID=659595 RepID=A0A7W8FYS8_9GAMM|nr:hypothetical protein [Chiayiivirga flava]MBB5207441.1 hypothetical protein [Chiayiivirga flava]
MNFTATTLALILLAGSGSALAQGVPTPSTGAPLSTTYRCGADLSADVALRPAAQNKGASIAVLKVNGRDVDPAVMRYVNSVAAERIIANVESACEDDKILRVTVALPASGNLQKDDIVLTVRGTTLKVELASAAKAAQ